GRGPRAAAPGRAHADVGYQLGSGGTTMWWRSERGQVPIVRLVLALVAAVALVLVFMKMREQQGGGVPLEPTAAPPFSGMGTLDHAQVLAYARSLHYDPEHGAGEARRLMVGCPPGPCRYGPLVRVEPEEGAVVLTKTMLAQGRVLVRMIN